LIVNN